LQCIVTDQSQGNARNNEAEGNGPTLQQNQTTNNNLQAHDIGQIHGILGYTAVEGMNDNLQHSQKFKNSNLEDNATPSGKQKMEVTKKSTEKQGHQNDKDNAGKPTNNKSSGKLSKKKRDSIKRKQQKDAEK